MIETVETAMIAKLEATIGVKSPRPLARFVDTLPAQLDERELERRIRQAPGCFVAFIGGPARGGQALIVDGTFAVYVLTQGAVEAVRRRTAYIIVMLAAGVLHRLQVPGIGTLMCQEISNLFAEALDAKGVSLYAAIFKIPLTVPNGADEKALADFLTFHADFLVAPHEPVPGETLPLPAPGTDNAEAADFSVTVTLPQGED